MARRRPPSNAVTPAGSALVRHPLGPWMSVLSAAFVKLHEPLSSAVALRHQGSGVESNQLRDRREETNSRIQDLLRWPARLTAQPLRCGARARRHPARRKRPPESESQKRWSKSELWTLLAADSATRAHGELRLRR